MSTTKDLKPNRKKRRLFTPMRLFILLLIIIVLIMGVWLGLRTAIVKGMTIGIRNMEAQGYQVAHGGLSVGGFPLSVKAASSNISVQAPAGAQDDPSKNWSVKLSDFDFGTATITPLSWQLRHRGDVRVDMRGAGGERYMFDITPAKIDARGAITFKGKLKSAQIDIGKATLSPLVGTPPAILGVKDAHIDVKINGSDAKLDINAHDVVLSDLGMGPIEGVFTRTFSEFSMTMTVKNWTDLETGGPEIWMQNGGGLVSNDWSIHWGKVDFIGDFDIHFKNGLPNGVLNVRIKDLEQLIDAVDQTGLANSQGIGYARTFARSYQPGKDGRIALPLPIRDGWVTFLSKPVYQLPGF